MNETVVTFCVAEGLSGLECLSGIPGSAGATPMVPHIGLSGTRPPGPYIAGFSPGS